MLGMRTSMFLTFEVGTLVEKLIKYQKYGKQERIKFFFVIIAIILGNALFNQFDFENLKFEKPALSIVYIVTFVFSIYFLIKNYKGRPEK